MKGNITISINVDVAQQFKAKYDNVSNRIEQLMKEDIKWVEDKHENTKDKIIKLKADLAEAVAKSEAEEEEKKVGIVNI